MGKYRNALSTVFPCSSANSLRNIGQNTGFYKTRRNREGSN